MPYRAGTDRHPLTWRLAAPQAGTETSPRQARSIPARLKSFGHAARGLGHVLRHEPNAWFHLAATGLAIAAGIVLDIAAGDWRWIVAAIAWVWAAEAVNTALEHLCDVVSPQRNETVRVAKDVAAGAVLAGAIGVAVVAALTLAPYLTG